MPELNALVFSTLDPVKDDGEILFGSGNEGYVYQLEYGTGDDGTEDIAAHWTTGWLDMEAPSWLKTFRYFYIWVKNVIAPITMSWSVDDGRATGSQTIRPSARFEPYMLSLPQDALGRKIQVTLSETSDGVGFEVVDYEVHWRPRRQLYAQRGAP